MKKNQILMLLIFLALLSIRGNLIPADDECTPTPPWESLTGPGGDTCEINHSLAPGISRDFNLAPEAVILKEGYWQEAMKLYGGLLATADLKANVLFESSPLLIIPTGGLFALQNESILKAMLQEYVRLGGTLIVFAQQYGSHIDNFVPLPQVSFLKSWGWREDQSCWSSSQNLQEMHPALAAMAAGEIKTDGQFTIHPGNSTILLRKGSNQEPVLLYYPCGKGTVILTSLYSDWAAAHTQASVSELMLVRDLITFARNPRQPIPMFDLNKNPTPDVSLQVKVKNQGENTAKKIIVKVTTPDRKTILFTKEIFSSIAPGGESIIPLHFTLPALHDNQLGICHTDYELYDSENNLQIGTDIDSGRFTPYRLKSNQTTLKKMSCRLTTENEHVYWDKKPQFTLQVHNNTDQEIIESFTYKWQHGKESPLTTLSVPAGNSVKYRFQVPLPANTGNCLQELQTFHVYRKFQADAVALKRVQVNYPGFANKIWTMKPKIISGNTQTLAEENADIKLIELPHDLAIAAGSFANITLKVKNEGKQKGEAKITMTAFDSLNLTRQVVLAAGEEKELTDIFLDVDADIPAGYYPCNYTLTGSGVINGQVNGSFNFRVSGITLNVEASLGCSLYNQGETAMLTLQVTTTTPIKAPLTAVVNWDNFNERRNFTLDNGSTSLVFEIPLIELSQDRIFYGIYQESGRGVYLNDINFSFAENINVILDKQVYMPGDSLHALFRVAEPGSLDVYCFKQKQTMAVTSQASVDFVVPTATLGGSHEIGWRFTPANTTFETIDGGRKFAVSGLAVKVAKAGLDRGQYSPGEPIKIMLTLEANMDATLGLRAWTIPPAGDQTYLGEKQVVLAADRQTPVTWECAFNTTEAGTHRLIYGLYKEDEPVVAGMAIFASGDAALIDMTTEHAEYPNGSETVQVKTDYYGVGTADLKFYLDDVQIIERKVILSGLGNGSITLNENQIGGGQHTLRAVMAKNGLISTKYAWFSYGSNLPDLTVHLWKINNDNLNYTYTIRVSNMGKTSTAASSLVLLDNDTAVQSVAVPALASNQYRDIQFNWNVSGKTDKHILKIAVDHNKAIKEFNEWNNVLDISNNSE